MTRRDKPGSMLPSLDWFNALAHKAFLRGLNDSSAHVRCMTRNELADYLRAIYKPDACFYIAEGHWRKLRQVYGAGYDIAKLSDAIRNAGKAT
jgi:hypothetical protein